MLTVATGALDAVQIKLHRETAFDCVCGPGRKYTMSRKWYTKLDE